MIHCIKSLSFHLQIVQTLNSSWAQMIMLLRTFPLRPLCDCTYRMRSLFFPFQICQVVITLLIVQTLNSLWTQMILLLMAFPLRLLILTLWYIALYVRFSFSHCKYVNMFLFQLLIIQTLNSSWTQMILLLSAFPLRPPISTFSSLRNCWAVRKNSLMMFKRSMKLSKRLKIKCSWN